MERITSKDMAVPSNITFARVYEELVMYENEAERKENGCEKCNNELPFYYGKEGYRVKMNFCAKCGRDLRGSK